MPNDMTLNALPAVPELANPASYEPNVLVQQQDMLIHQQLIVELNEDLKRLNALIKNYNEHTNNLSNAQKIALLKKYSGLDNTLLNVITKRCLLIMPTAPCV